MEPGQIRQGDVLLCPTLGVAPPADAQPVSEAVLALGEITGHAHRVMATALYDWVVDGERYIFVASPEPGVIVHETHDPIPAPVLFPGVAYRVVPQQEWDLNDEWRVVAD